MVAVAGEQPGYFAIGSDEEIGHLAAGRSPKSARRTATGGSSATAPGARVPGSLAFVDFAEVMESVAKVFEAIGVAIIAFGGLYALVRPAVARGEDDSYFEEARRRLAHPLLLGLEVLVAADIILTITIDPSLESVTTLGVLVLIRVVLSFSLDIEIEGMFPWRRAQGEDGPSATGPSDA